MEELKPLEDATALINTFFTLGQIAQRAKDNYVVGQVLDRIGIKKSQDSKFHYDLNTKKILVYEPRLWCSQCQNKKAAYKYQDKIYCHDCIELVKKEIAKPLDTKKEKEIKEKNSGLDEKKK